MGKLSVFSLVYSLVLLLGFSQNIQAQPMCSELFQKSEVRAVIESDADFKKLDRKIRDLEVRIRRYSELTGSETNRSSVDAENYANKIKDQVRLGLTNKVVEQIGPIFKRYEVDIRISTRLQSQINFLKKHHAQETSNARQIVIEEMIRGKQAEKNVLDKYIGQNYYKYISLKTALTQMVNSKYRVVSERAQEVVNELNVLSSNHGEMYQLAPKKLTVEDVKRFVQTNIRSQHALLKKAAVDEFFLMLRLMTFSGPLVNALKAVIYKVPEKIVMGPFVVPARKVISEAFMIGYNQHLRSQYLEDIEMIIEAANPREQYELLRSLNVKSEKPDELLELFSRVVENTEEWEAIKSVALERSTENERFKLFYDRIMAADKSALEKDAFPLYYQEPGATAFGKLILGSYVSAYMGNKYLEAHPQAMDPFFGGLLQFTQAIQSLFM